MSATKTLAASANAGVRAEASFNPWPYALIAFFAVAIVGTALLVYISVTHSSDLVAPDYYDQEMRYQRRYDQLKRTLPFEDRIAVNVAEGGFQIGLPKEHATAGVEGTIELYRPSAARADQTFPMAVTRDGVQTVAFPGLASGLWKVRLHWASGGQEYYSDRNLVVPAAGSGQPSSGSR